MNQVIFSQLSVATVGVSSHHLTKQYENDNNGYGGWNALCEWYNADYLKNETEDYLRIKMEIYLLTSYSNTKKDVNNFLTLF